MFIISLLDFLIDGQSQDTIVLRIDISSLTDEAWQCIENILRNLLDNGVFNALIGEASLKDVLPPATDVVGNLVTEDARVLR
jgi:hypothetical protein